MNKSIIKTNKCTKNDFKEEDIKLESFDEQKVEFSLDEFKTQWYAMQKKRKGTKDMHNSIETMLKQNNFELIHWTNQYFGIVTQYHCAWTRANAGEFVAYVSVLFIFMFICMQQGNKVGDTALSHWQFHCDWKSVCVAYWHLVFNMLLHCTFHSKHSKCTLHVNINLFVNV